LGRSGHSEELCSWSISAVRAHRSCKRAERRRAQGVTLKEVAKQEKLEESVLRKLLEYRRKENRNGQKKKGTR
jgi:hypothetical protein